MTTSEITEHCDAHSHPQRDCEACVGRHNSVWNRISAESTAARHARVMDYGNGGRLDGVCSVELLRESRAAGDTGAVYAYRAWGRVWQYVAPRDLDAAIRNGQRVITVYVEEVA